MYHIKLVPTLLVITSDSGSVSMSWAQFVQRTLSVCWLWVRVWRETLGCHSVSLLVAVRDDLATASVPWVQYRGLLTPSQIAMCSSVLTIHFVHRIHWSSHRWCDGALMSHSCRAAMHTCTMLARLSAVHRVHDSLLSRPVRRGEGFVQPFLPGSTVH